MPYFQIVAVGLCIILNAGQGLGDIDAQYNDDDDKDNIQNEDNIQDEIKHEDEV